MGKTGAVQITINGKPVDNVLSVNCYVDESMEPMVTVNIRGMLVLEGFEPPRKPGETVQ